MTKQNKHIILFPLMAQGHYSPFISLASLLSQTHPHTAITIVTTPLETHKLQSLLPSSASLDIRVKSIPFDPSHHGLPSENTGNLSVSQMATLLHSTLSLQPHFKKLVLDTNPICIIADIFLSWTVEIARELGVFHATFTTCGAYGSALYFSLWLHLPHLLDDRPSPFSVPGFPQILLLHHSQIPETMFPGEKSAFRIAFYRKIWADLLRSDAVLCNTADGLEPAGLELFQRIVGGRPRVWPIGPLVLPPKPDHSKRSAQFVEWLDAQPSGSVLYVSFGSQSTVSASKMKELAAALERSGVRFIWVVRPPLGSDPGAEFEEEWLPEGFEDRTVGTNRGMIVKKWAPQIEILRHGGVGGFLSHCGWNSVVESLSNGVPIVGWPLGGEQFFNAKMLVEELGVCVEVARGVNGGEGSHEIERGIRVVMGGGNEGLRLRTRAARCARILKEAVGSEGGVKGSSVRAVEEFVGSISG